MTTKFSNVTFTPPKRSDNMPPTGRANAPRKGPKKANFKIMTSETGFSITLRNQQKTDKRAECRQI